jgi:hypothetical protein
MTSSLRRMVEDIHSACWAGQLLLVQTDLCGTIHATVETDRTALLDERYGDVTPIEMCLFEETVAARFETRRHPLAGCGLASTEEVMMCSALSLGAV